MMKQIRFHVEPPPEDAYEKEEYEPSPWLPPLTPGTGAWLATAMPT
ncbi:MAG: hypothetical protein ACLP9L_40200 [Thermoguttaceae bacterium]|jgi:hypothetical protein